MQKITPFRLWLHQIWLDNCAEHDTYGELPYTMQEYWQRYRYWLRREYRFQQRKATPQTTVNIRSIAQPRNVSSC